MTLAKTLPVSDPYENNTLSYPFYFNVGGADEVIVWVGNTRVYEGFTIDLGENGGEVTFNSIPEDKVTITANVDFSQEVDLVNNSAFLPEVIEDGLDKLTRMAQINKAELQRAVKVPYGSEDTPEEYAEKLINSVEDAARFASLASESAASAESAKAYVEQEVQGFSETVESAKSEINTAKEEAVSKAEEATNKAEEAVTEATSAKDTAKEALGKMQGILDNVDSVTAAAVNAVNSAKGTAVDAVNEAKEEAISQIGGSVGRVYRPKGTVSAYGNLPMSGNEVGDVYTVLDTGAEYFWKEDNSWEYLGDKIDLSAYAKKSDVPSVEGLASETYVNNAVKDKANKSELFSKSYNDLTDKPTIPSVEGLASTKYVDGEIDKIELVLGNLDTALAVTESEVI